MDGASGNNVEYPGPNVRGEPNSASSDVFFLRSRFCSVAKKTQTVSLKKMTQAIAGAERDMASRFRNDLDTNICGRGKSRIPLTDEERVHRVQWLEQYCGKIKRPHLKQSLVDFLKKQTEIVNTHTTKEAPEHPCWLKG